MATPMDARAVAGLSAEILAQARSEAERLLAAARLESERLRAEARAEADRDRKARLAAAQAQAARSRELTLASLPLLESRLRDDRRAALLEEIRAQAASGLEAGLERAGRPATLAALAAEALRAMEGESFVLTLSPRDRSEAGLHLAEEIARLAGRRGLALSFEEDAALAHGVVVRDSAGHQRWDNRLSARLERLWPRLRSRVLAEAGLPEAAP